MYGYLFHKKNTPKDNIWKEGREIELKDDSIVFGYEGKEIIPSSQGVSFKNADHFNAWQDDNTPKQDNENI